MSSPEEIPSDAVQALRDRSRRLARALGLMQSRVDGTGCTPAQCHALIEVSNHGQLTTKEVSELLCVDKSTASRALQSLVRGDQLEATADPGDQRAKPLRLTAKGRRSVRRIHAMADAQVERALRLLSREERETVLEGIRLYEVALRRSRTLEEVVIRPIGRRDQRVMAQIIRGGLTEFGAVGDGFSIHDDEIDDLHRSYSGTRRGYFVAERAGEVVAGAGFAPLDGASSGGDCELRKMFALPQTRGLGIGRLLLEACLGSAREAGYERCYLETLAHMLRARALYEKLGFRALDAPMGDTGHYSCDAWYLLDLDA